MPIVLAIGLSAAVGLYAVHKLRQELRRLEAEDAKQEERKKAEIRRQRQANVNTLKRDPKTGVYRLDDD